jgi:hypothetical protein
MPDANSTLSTVFQTVAKRPGLGGMAGPWHRAQRLAVVRATVDHRRALRQEGA